MATYWSDMYWRRTCVYRAYDADGALLYVGLSMNLEGRLSKHRRSAWWPKADEITVQWFENRESAQAAERAAIRDEDPIYNIVRPNHRVQIREVL
jgi:excinuclease UvrABC nuclease subunit